jgi:hypothetical protein
MARDLAAIIGIPLAVLVALIFWWRPWQVEYELGEGEDRYELLTGIWDWDGETGRCDSPHRISFDPARKVMTISNAVPIVDSSGIPHQATIYDIEEHGDRIRGRIRGETRTTEAGEPVVWDLVLTSRDSYAWARAGWSVGGQTREIERCVDSMVSSAAKTALVRPDRAREIFDAVAESYRLGRPSSARVWGVTADTVHFLAADLAGAANTQLYLLTARDGVVRLVDSTTIGTTATRLIIESRHLGERHFVLVEPMSRDLSLGLIAVEAAGDSLIRIPMPRVRLAGPQQAATTIDAATVTEHDRLYRLSFDADLQVESEDGTSHLMCRVEPTAPLALQESPFGWSIQNGHTVSSCKEP